ncbi:uncharacterized protein F5891DRAFT_1185945 [Suillus fuscotomentosus]|uniref:Uncharacterized protein n=1 Tax=Suillus fuscotomentosus TaxID=1912939 RepID=A0AAD4EAQ0_9AGAM|nr:uncharacterized protein F5891DRAFT_1185945 [Suillus fuscotomentosus]KAG1902815.1 hypothetical protein F5891DRAFT_1185945 [Suillus fuscotomentosus]
MVLTNEEKANSEEISSQKKALAEKCLKRKTDYHTALAEAQDILMQEAVKMHEMLGSHTVDYYYEAIIQTSHMTKHQRACNLWNTYLHAEVKSITKHYLTMNLVVRLLN